MVRLSTVTRRIFQGAFTSVWKDFENRPLLPSNLGNNPKIAEKKNNSFKRTDCSDWRDNVIIIDW